MTLLLNYGHLQRNGGIEMSLRFILDAETDGLYGPFLTVALSVSDSHGTVLDEFYGGVSPSIARAKDPWVIENVIPILGNYEGFSSEEELLEEVWCYWEKYRNDAQCFIDVPFPVESRLLMKIVARDMAERAMLAPFPIIDLASLLYGKGYDPLVNRLSLISQHENQHNALSDVRIIREILEKILD